MTFLIGVDGLGKMEELPIGDSVSEVFTGNVDGVELLSFLDFALDFVLFSKRPEFLSKVKSYFSVGATNFGTLFVHGDEVFSRFLVGRWLELLPSTDD